MAQHEFPIFDLSRFEAAGGAEKAGLAETVDVICRGTGFLAVTGHAVPEQVVADIWKATQQFFDLPIDRKLEVSPPYPGYPYGYLRSGSEALAKSRNVNTPPDIKESFNSGPATAPTGLDDPQALEFCYADTPWPSQPDGFQSAWRAYYRAMEQLAERIMRVFAAALGLPDRFFDPFIDRPISALRALNYPEQETPPEPGQLRAGAHSDYGSLTILLPQAGSTGLQIFTPDGHWSPVPPIEGAFVINIGDLMARWTNDRWRSTLHRVANPVRNASARRQSLAFFHQPNWDAEISCIETCLDPDELPAYTPVHSGPYLMSKFQSTVDAG